MKIINSIETLGKFQGLAATLIHLEDNYNPDSIPIHIKRIERCLEDSISEHLLFSGNIKHNLFFIEKILDHFKQNPSNIYFTMGEAYSKSISLLSRFNTISLIIPPDSHNSSITCLDITALYNFIYFLCYDKKLDFQLVFKISGMNDLFYAMEILKLFKDVPAFLTLDNNVNENILKSVILFLNDGRLGLFSKVAFETKI